MGTFLTAVILAAGVGALIYSQLGKRVGYGNGKQVWTLVGLGFGVTFVVIMIASFAF